MRHHTQRGKVGATGLALVLCLALAACMGPTVIEPHAARVGPYDVTLKTDPPTMQSGQKATLNYFFRNPADGNKPVTNLALVHERPIHVFVVDRALGYFKHEHSSGVAAETNSYPINVLFGHEGTYRVYAEFAPTVVVTDTAGKKQAQAGDTLVFSNTISFGTTGQVEAEAAQLEEDERAKNAGGVTIALHHAPIHARQPTTLTFTLSELGTPIHTLALYLGEAGHAVVLDAEGNGFAHLHSLETMGEHMGTSGAGGQVSEPGMGMGVGAGGSNPGGVNTPLPGGSPVAGQTTPIGGTGGMAMPTVAVQAAPTINSTPSGIYRPLPTVPPSTSMGGGIYGPDVTFEHEFEEPGLYKVWGQFLYRGYVLTGDFVVRVSP